MTREQLEHAIRAACEVSEDTEIWIFGSQAILGEFPNAPKDLRASIEVDVQPKNRSDNCENTFFNGYNTPPRNCSGRVAK
jgi:hypothetical protein